MSKFLKLPLQYFAEGGDGGTTGTDENNQTPPAKTFSQEDVNNIVARESKSAVERLLKEAGITAENGDHKKALSDFKTWQDSQKSELEKVTGSLSALEKEKADALSKATALEHKFTAVSKGIPADKADKYIKLAEAYTSDTIDFKKAIDLALKDFPVAEKGTPGAGGNPPPTETNKPALPKGTVIF